MPNQKCKICGSKNIGPYHQGVKGFGIDKDYDIYQCQDCQIVFTYPYLTRKELDDYFDTQELAINGISDEAFITEYQEHRAKYWQEFGYNGRIDQIRSLAPKAKTLLDIGCGAGFFLDCARDRGFKVKGLEISQWSYAIATQSLKLDITKSPLERINPATFATFDVVTMFDVLEHSDNPVEDIQMVKKLLNPGGILIVNLPNIDSMMSKRIGKHWNKLIPPNHTFFFSPTTIRNVISDQGLTIESLETNNGDSREITAELAASVWLVPGKKFPAFADAFSQKAEPYQHGMTWQRGLVKSTHTLFYRLGFLAEPLKPWLIRRGLGEGIRIAARKVA